MYESPYLLFFDRYICVFLGLAGLASLYLHSLICDLPSPSAWNQEYCRGIRNTEMRIRIPLFPLKRPDPDPTGHVYEDPNPDPVPQVIQICDQRFTDSPRLRFLSHLRLHCERPRPFIAAFWASRPPEFWLLNRIDPDPAFEFDAVPDQAPESTPAPQRWSREIFVELS